jgi:hypothetical protein
MLAAIRISFLHPVTGHRLDLKSPLARDFCEVLLKLGMDREV